MAQHRGGSKEVAGSPEQPIAAARSRRPVGAVSEAARSALVLTICRVQIYPRLTAIRERKEHAGEPARAAGYDLDLRVCRSASLSNCAARLRSCCLISGIVVLAAIAPMSAACSRYFWAALG